jgi:hypothetical protein
VRRTPRPVVALTRVDGANVARYDDGQTLRSHTGLAWHPMSLSTAGINTEFSVCPQGMTGRHWQGLPKVARPEVDFGSWAYVLPRGGVGFVVLAYGGTQYRRLIETTDAGRTWRVVHRWR